MAKILVVDDEIGIRELLSDILSDEGYTVYTAENAESARLQISQETLDLILLDIWMPDTDGISLLKELGSKHMLHCPVVMMSGHGTIETAVEATKFGALNFLEKPISMQKLLQTVRHGIEVRNRIIAMAPYWPDPKPEIGPRPVPEPEVGEPLPVPEEHAETQPEPESSQGPAQPNPENPPLPSITVIHGTATELPRYVINGTGIVIDFNLTLREVRDAVEKGYLLALMQHENCQMTRVAKHAGLERTHLYRKLKGLNLDIPRTAIGAGGEADESVEVETNPTAAGS